MSVLCGYMAQKLDRAARVRKAARLAGRVGIAGVVAAAGSYDRDRGCLCIVVLPRLALAAAEHGVNAFHPHLLDRRLGVARLVVSIVLSIIILSFFRTQILGHGKYQLQSETNRLRPIPLPAPRGGIFDRNGRRPPGNGPGLSRALLPGSEANRGAT